MFLGLIEPSAGKALRGKKSEECCDLHSNSQSESAISGSTRMQLPLPIDQMSRPLRREEEAPPPAPHTFGTHRRQSAQICHSNGKYLLRQMPGKSENAEITKQMCEKVFLMRADFGYLGFVVVVFRFIFSEHLPIICTQVCAHF